MRKFNYKERRVISINKNDESYIHYLVGQNLKKIRKEKKISVAKFAQMSNYSEGFIMNLESPKYNQTVSFGTVWRLAKVLDIDFRRLFDDVD